MRISFRIAALAAGLAYTGLLSAGGYVLTVGGKATELDLDQDVQVVVDGKPVSVRLQRKAEQVFRDRGIRFEYPAAVQPTSSDVTDEVRQIMLVSAHGNGVILQRYEGLDPTALIDLMVKETTDEEVAAGYKRKITPATQTKTDGRELRGKLARTESAGESWDRVIVATGDRNGGYLVITMLEEDRAAADVAMIERFWKTLKLD